MNHPPQHTEEQARQPHSPLLRDLARAYRVSTEYRGFDGQLRPVADDTLAQVLAALGVPVADAATQQASLDALHGQWWTQPSDAFITAIAGSPTTVLVRGQQRPATVILRGHRRRQPAPEGRWELSAESVEAAEHTQVDGRDYYRWDYALPHNLDCGWYELVIDGEKTADVAITPAQAPQFSGGRCWGGQTQLYATTSAASWGIGDFVDLAQLAEYLAADGADFLLINPVHALSHQPQPGASPYSPTSRRFVEPLYIRPEACPEYAQLSGPARKKLRALCAEAQTLNKQELLDRAAVWALKGEALALLYQHVYQHHRPGSNTSEDASAQAYFQWCAQHQLPEQAGPLLQKMVTEPDFHRWLQQRARQQLAAAQQRAVQAGMRIGIIHDLAVGVDGASADAALLGPVLVPGMHVGAPPDMFNQVGQDWGQPPWQPQLLAAQGYQAWWDVLCSIFRDCGAVRIDHILGLFRLWWIPQGCPPGQGAYIYYDEQALIGLCVLAAQHYGALVIGEDLGTFDSNVTETLAERGIYGTTVYLFEHDGGQVRSPQGYRSASLACLTTHDLPPTAGYFQGEHIRLRAALGVLTASVESETEALNQQLAGLVEHLRHRGLLAAEANPPQTADLVLAAHRDLAAAASQLVAVSLVDVVGQEQVQNQPGTSTEYPNWCVPLADAQQRRVPWTQLRQQPAYQQIVAQLNDLRPRGAQ